MNEEEKPKRDEKGRLLPGNTANLKGRPKRKSFRDYFNEEEEADLINKIKQAIPDKTDILKMTVEQIFGKPKQPISGVEDEPILVKQVNYERNNSAAPIRTEGLPIAISPSDPESKV